MQQTNKKEVHDWVGKVINRELCKRLKFDQTTKWYEMVYAQTRIHPTK